MIRIIIADDHDIVREGIRRILETEQGMEVVGETGTGREAIRLCAELKPDVALLDLDMPGIDGLEATRQITSASPGVKVVILTMHDNEEYAIRALQAGASGFILKGSSPEDLPLAVRKAAEGKTHVVPSIMEKITLRHARGGGENPLSLLSTRELQILSRVARGMRHIEIADELKLSLSAVGTYKTRLMDKLALSNNAELVQFAIKNGLLNTGLQE